MLGKRQVKYYFSHAVVTNTMLSDKALDRVDVQILSRLQENSKLTVRELAEELGLSQTPIYERIKKMERSGVIRQYIALLNAKKLDLGLLVYMSLTVEDSSSPDLYSMIAQLKSMREVVELYQITGDSDYLALIRTKDLITYKELLLNEIGNFNNVKEIYSYVVLDRVKFTTSLPIPS